MPCFKIIKLRVPKKKTLKGLTIYRHGGHLGHVTMTIVINPCSPLTKRLRIKFDQVISEKKMFENNGHIHMHIHVAPGQGQAISGSHCCSKNTNIVSIWSFAARFSH